MKTTRAAVSVCILLLVAVGIDATAGGPTYEELELSWDDGNCGGLHCDRLEARPDQRVAVHFDAPSWAGWVISVRVHIVCDAPPGVWSSFEPAEVVVFAPSAELPPEPSSELYSGALEWPEENPPCANSNHNRWLEHRLDPPLALGPSTALPDREFFVGLVWVHRLAPSLGVDTSEPVDQQSLFDDWTGWALLDEGDVMVRAVVADSLATSVEGRDWGVIKALFRRNGARVPN